MIHSSILKFITYRQSICSGMIFILMFTSLISCDSSTPSATIKELPALTNKIAHKDDFDNLASKSYLEIKDRAIAARWLALKERHNDPPSGHIDFKVKRYEELIRFLAEKLKEDPRMIANRTVQIQELLQESNIHESLGNILEGMSSVARTGVIGSYGSYCQWYLNLRQSQTDHTATIANMKSLKQIR